MSTERKEEEQASELRAFVLRDLTEEELEWALVLQEQAKELIWKDPFYDIMAHLDVELKAHFKGYIKEGCNLRLLMRIAMSSIVKEYYTVNF